MYLLMIVMATLLIVMLVYAVLRKKELETEKETTDKSAPKLPEKENSPSKRWSFKLFSRQKMKKVDPLFTVKISVVEMLIVSLVFGAMGFVVTWFFYLNVYVSVISAVIFQGFIIVYKKEKTRKHKNMILDEFININNLLLAELQTGIAVSRAYENLANNIQQSEILDFPKLEPEIRVWINRLHVGEEITDILLDFANRSGENNLVQFANMLDIASSRGGNILDIILSTNSVLNDERQMMYDVEVLITEKKLEQRVLTAMPIFILMFLNYSAYEFIAPLYENVIGRMTMTALLVIFTISFFWSRKITEIGNGY